MTLGLQILFHQGPYLSKSGEGGLQLISKAIYFIGVTIFLTALPSVLAEVTIYPGGKRKGAYS
jgi:hypothetical protein